MTKEELRQWCMEEAISFYRLLTQDERILERERLEVKLESITNTLIPLSAIIPTIKVAKEIEAYITGE